MKKFDIAALRDQPSRDYSMRKLVVLSLITLDGVMQAPGGPEEDPTGGFKHGGWVFPPTLTTSLAE